MTVLDQGRDIDSPMARHPRLLPNIVLGIGPIAALLTVIVSLTSGVVAWTTTIPTSALTFALLALAFGIPHGAVDHLTIGRTLPPRILLFLGAGYVAAAAVAATAVIIAPVPSFAVVIAMSVWHFGTGDVEARAELGRSAPVGTGVRWLRTIAAGSVPLLLPLTSAASVASLEPLNPEVAQLLGGPASTGVRVLVLLVVVVTTGTLLRVADWRGAVELASLTLLGLVATPLIAFAVYFAAWHSLRHTARLAQDTDDALSLKRIGRVVRTGLPALGATVAVVAVVVVGTSRGSSLGSWLWVALAVVWGLTVPHMLAVSRFDRLRRRAREHELSASDR